ncbi:helix-turn-helix domain-containing protein [Hymenobacter guriensis]|uniref:Helix-turn-helix domain-containing protein n=1 Tax=Hymenobacter guriensis TaxID=2793065 RepID=A0ABS0L1F9_9BACT|nr:helix-turn-helix transcriptional regulator [Hymenobacter guriensis]MBG8553944.1 helix-turn-helix domain-containing protein [Hymenobacter guriensis]
MVERIRTLLAARQLTPTQFADLIGVGRPIVSHILSGRNKPSLEVIQKVIAAFPDLAMPWLLSGIGPMWTGEEAERPTVAEKLVKKPVSRPRLAELPAPEVVAAPVTPAPSSEPTSLPPAPTPALEPAAAPSVATLAGAVPSLIAPTAPVAEVSETAGTNAQLANMPLAALAEPDKAIRRIVIFYQDGTFSAYQPE